MDTLLLPDVGRPRRRYATEFKAQLLAACQQPGISVTAIALANQINPNVVRRWLRESRRSQPVPVETDVACHDQISAAQADGPSGLVPVEVMGTSRQPCRSSGANVVHADRRAQSNTTLRESAASSTASIAEPIQVELRSGNTLLKVAWPAAQAEVCALWLRGVLS